MVTVGIMGVVMMAMISTQNFLSSENRALTEKMAALDFQQQLVRSFADDSLCTSLLKSLTFDATYATADAKNKPTITLARNSIPISTLPAAPSLATAGLILSPLSQTLIATPAQTFQVTDIAGSKSSGVGTYTGNFRVNFEQTKLIRALNPVSIKIVMQTTGGGSTQTISSCRSGVASVFSSCHSVSAMTPGGPHFVANAYCANGEIAVSGGATCETPSPPWGGVCSGTASGVVNRSAPSIDPVTGNQGWGADCYDPMNHKEACAMATVICCR